jgi:hypothetical protein
MIKEVYVNLYDSPYYEISNLGNVRSLDRVVIGKNGISYPFKGKELKQRSLSEDNPQKCITVNCPILGFKNKTIYIQKAVAEHFLEKPSPKHIYASNISGNYDDNSINNIKWITHIELMRKQPKRLENPLKFWNTRREKYKNKWGSKEEPKWNPTKQWETKRKKKELFNKN